MPIAPFVSKAAGIRKVANIVLDPERTDMYHSDAGFRRALCENLSEEFASVDEIIISDGLVVLTKFRPETYVDGDVTVRFVARTQGATLPRTTVREGEAAE